MATTSRSALVAGLLALSANTGCDKLKSALGKGDAGGTGASGTGVLSFLGSDFEGEIAATVTTKSKPQKGGPQQLVFGIKKPKYRVDASGGSFSDNPSLAAGGAILIDPPTKKAWLLMPAQKMAVVVDLEKVKSMPKGQLPGLPNAPKGAPAVPAKPPTIDKTGKKDVVAGYSCEIWNVTSEGKRSEVCVAEGITWIDLADIGMGASELAVAAVAADANRFPLRLVAYDAKGAEEMRMEATKVEKKKLDDARFVVPPDYRVVDMAAMMGGLLGPKGLPGFAPPKAP